MEKKIGNKNKGWTLKTYRQIDNNTIKKDIYQWERGHAGEDWIIQVEPYVKTEKRLLSSKQRFALVVTIEDLRKEIDLYTPIKTQFDTDMEKLRAVSAVKAQPQRLKKA